ncbi:MAG: UbiA family prenyltransferase [Candidatus Heimdallarchaeota archaeon]
MTEITPIEEKKFLSILKLIISPFRLMHALPVMTVTTMIGFLAYFSLDGLTADRAIGSFITLILAVFFQQAFVGIHNDYYDHQQDISYNKSKAISDGWVSAKTAFWFSVAFFIIFSGLSFGMGYYSRIGYWSVLYLQGINLICLTYNFFLKNTPFSIVPYLILFPTAPFFVWVNFEDFAVFEWNKLWICAVMFFAAIIGHIANEVPDLEYDMKYNKKNTAVFFGEKTSTIIYVISSFLSQLIIIIPYALYYQQLNYIVFIVVMSLSTLAGLGALGMLWKNKWKTNNLVFNLFTGHIGINAIGIVILLSI